MPVPVLDVAPSNGLYLGATRDILLVSVNCIYLWQVISISNISSYDSIVLNENRYFIVFNGAFSPSNFRKTFKTLK